MKSVNIETGNGHCQIIYRKKLSERSNFSEIFVNREDIMMQKISSLEHDALTKITGQSEKH